LQIWQIADTENRGLLTKPGFCVVLRLIGHYQAGRDPTPELALRRTYSGRALQQTVTNRDPAAPLPKFEGLNLPTTAPPPNAPPPQLQAQSSGGPIRVPPLTPDKANEYSSLFEKSGAQNGILSGKHVLNIQAMKPIRI
jgi:epidermal growth factor receptor substrate 15